MKQQLGTVAACTGRVLCPFWPNPPSHTPPVQHTLVSAAQVEKLSQVCEAEQVLDVVHTASAGAAGWMAPLVWPSVLHTSRDWAARQSELRQVGGWVGGQSERWMRVRTLAAVRQGVAA